MKYADSMDAIASIANEARKLDQQTGLADSFTSTSA